MAAEPALRRHVSRRVVEGHAGAVFAGLFCGLLFVSVGGVIGSEGVHSATCTLDEHGMCSDEEVSVFHGGGRSLLQACDPAVTCFGNGACVTDAGSGLTSCDCFTGFSPPNCSEVVDCAALGWCNQRGICVKGGICACDPGWDGAGCTMAMCPQNCNGHGACNASNRVCMCDLGWSGRACSIQGCVGNCSNHGVCADGDCECDPGYEGANCENFVCINECSGHGACNQVAGRCECSPWFTGEDCSTALCPSNCSQHGTCVNGECVCDSGWSASDCSSHLCPQACSLRGTCQTDGVCICQTGYMGDACQLSTTCEVYDCSGHGTCRFDSGQNTRNATCDCDPGWSGGGCEAEAVAASEVPCLNNCSSHGSCMGGECVCDDTWDGPDCSARVGGCPGDCNGQGSCVNGTCACDAGFTGDDCMWPDSAVLCASNCSSGVGEFRNGSCVCSPAGGGGGGEALPCPFNCSERGSCVNGTCECDAGFGGEGCEEAVAAAGAGAGGCVNNCSGHGACFNGTCVCDMLWGGDDCSAAVSGGGGGGGCPGNCSARGACMEDGRCLCDPGFLGPDCGLDAADAPPCALNCSSRGVCVNSTCVCEEGYAGGWCEELAGVGSTPMPGGNASGGAGGCPADELGEACSGRGSCVEGACVCDPFWRGEACGSAAPRIIAECPGDCSDRGTCLNGTCMCDPMWDGLDCSYPSQCPGFTAAGGLNCSGHGACVNGTCLCDGAWGGVDCSIEACPDKCSGHGICANSTCLCDLGWTGRTCDEPGCPADCSGHGACGADAATGRPTCTCQSGWMGAGCGDPRCPTDWEHSAPYVPCSGNGACFQDGTCTCYDNFEGADCSVLNDCSGRGVRRCGFCECQDGYEGGLCEFDVCEDSRVFDPADPGNHSLATVCSGKGRCTSSGGCICEAGWAGRNCSQAAVCESTCEERNGVCFGSRDDPGTCDCGKYDIPGTVHDTLEWTGRYCTFRQCPGYRGIDNSGTPVVCSGKGICDQGLYQCTCFNVQGEGPYTGIDCGVPPLYKITSITPKVGPLEGGTLVSVVGPGLERLLPVVAPKTVYCDFGSDIRYPATVADFPDALICVSPPVSQATPEGVPLTLTDADGLPLEEFFESLASFEYFAHPRIVRLSPAYGPLRPQGGPNEFRGPSSTNQPNTVTITGTYFPPNGRYRCRFGDCEVPDGAKTTWVDTATVVCEMPEMAAPGRVQVAVTANAQQYTLPQEGSAGQFSVFGLTSVSPQCASSNGEATLTVRGEMLVDPTDAMRTLGDMYCRFGRVTLSGKTKLGLDYQPGFKLFAFHSKAAVSERAPGALECRVPDWPIETSDFAITLEGSFVESDPDNGDGYYHGQWDATPAVTFDSFYQPEILLLPGPGNQMRPHPYILEPTIGPVLGGTRVTVAGLGFDFARYGPNTGNNLFAAWSPSKPFCNREPIPSCKFGSTVTRRVEILNNETLVCITPVLPEPIENTQTVVLEVALDGQTYSTASPAIQYTFHPEHAVTSFAPSAGVRTGGTVITVRGESFVDSDTGDAENNRAAPKVLTCVFISVDSPEIRYVSQATRFISPEEITCVSPSIPAPAEYILDVSLSGQLADSQLSGSGIKYVFYQDPFITDLRDDIGSVNGNEVVAVVGENFLSLETLFCRFGDVVVPGELVAGTIQCLSPPVDEPQTVDLEVTMNGIDFSVTVPPRRYTFFDLEVLEPSSGPIHGGTYIFARIVGGPDMSYFRTNGAPRFSIQGQIGDLPATFTGTYEEDTDRITFAPPVDAATGAPTRLAFAPTGELPFRISLTSSRRFAAFPGKGFILYDASFLSVLPCASGNCRDLVLPKNGVEYPVTFTGTNLVGVDTIKCGFIPVNRTGGARQAFEGFTAGDLPPIVFDGTYDPVAQQVYCKSPPLGDADALEGYTAAVALNGQNFVGRDFGDETFNLMYLPQPQVTSLSSSAGQATGGMLLTVTGSSWNFPSWYRGGAPPATLSCLFFLPSQGTFKFSKAIDPQCSGDPLVCTAVCETPEFVDYTAYGRHPSDKPEGSLVRAQVFMSLNRRDPCMRCGCLSTPGGTLLGTDGFGKADCSDRETDDGETMLSRYDAETMGFCSEDYMVLADAHFCKGRDRCPLRDPAQEAGTAEVVEIDDSEFKCLGTEVYQGFVFYARPAVRAISPGTVGGPEVANKSATDAGAVELRLNGDFLAGSQWASWPATGWPAGGAVTVRVTYMDLHNFTTVLQGAFAPADPASSDPERRAPSLSVRLPMPCVDIEITSNVVAGQPLQYSPALSGAELQRCFDYTGVRLNQTRERMDVSFEVSFNGGVQYAQVPQTLGVYKQRQCPDGGCGHGDCVFYDQNPPTNPAYPLATLPNGQGRNRVRTCFCGWWAGEELHPPGCATGNNGIDSANDLYRTAFRPCKDNILWFDVALDTGNQFTDPQKMYTLWDMWGRPGLWPHHDSTRFNPQELGCTAGPKVERVSPQIGALAGGTRVMLHMLLSGTSWDIYTEQRRSFGLAAGIEMPRPLEGWFVCLFSVAGGSPVQADPVRVRFSDQSTVAQYACVTPPASSFAPDGEPADVRLDATYRNALNRASPLMFEGGLTFRYRPLPVVDRVLMDVGGERVPARSIPICAGDCGSAPSFCCFSIVLEGSGFYDTPELVCRINGVRTMATYLSPSHVSCSLLPAGLGGRRQANGTAPTFAEAGSYLVEVSLNALSDSDNEFVPAGLVDFYDQPSVVKDDASALSFGVDPSLVGTSVASVLGSDDCGTQCNTKQNEYAQLGPTSGGTPVVLYLSEPAGTSRVGEWHQRRNITLKFGECETSCPPGTPEGERYGFACRAEPRCSCQGAHVAKILRSDTQPGGGISDQLFKLTARTPSNVTRTGKYLMCLSMNGVHFLPMRHGSGAGTPFYWRYYETHRVTKLSLTDGPINLPFLTYNLEILGDNFPVKPTPEVADCDWVEVGICRDFAPRLFVYIGTAGTTVGGYGSLGQLTPLPFDSPLVNVSSGRITMEMPDMSVISANDFTANVTVSFNGYDFSPVHAAVTEFSFYRIPSVSRELSPKWGHYDSATKITVFGNDFQPTPGRSMCRISSCSGACDAEGPYRTLVPATYVSPTQMTCEVVARPPFVPTAELDADTSRRVFVSFTPDGRQSIQRDDPVMYEKLVSPVGQFSYTNEIRFLNVSARAAPTSGGTTLTLVVTNHRDNHVDTGVVQVGDKDCLDMTPIDTLVVGLLPTSSSVWKIVRPSGFGDHIPAVITDRRFQFVSVVVGNFEQGICYMYIDVELPVVPYPLEADLKISFNDGQHFTGPSTPMIFYNPTPPESNIPSRGSRSSAVRPQLTVYFDNALFAGANPEFTVSQTLNAFTPTPACEAVARGGAPGVCAMGPKCRFTTPSGVIKTVAAVFAYDPFQSLVTCTAPTFDASALAEVAVSLDGQTFYADGSTTFLFFDVPEVRVVLPTTGFWDARTNLLLSGTGFLSATGDTHLTWCLFDYRDVLPASDAWDVPRRWTKAYILPDGNGTLVQCASPVIGEGERPTTILPRARVGVIIDGICQDQDASGACTLLKNSDSVIFSDAFFIYTNIPSVATVRPKAALSGGGDVKVTISGTGFLDQYTWGPPAEWNRGAFPIGFEQRELKKLCVAGAAPQSSPDCPGVNCCPGLSCRFGQECPADGIGACRDRVVDGTLEGGNVVCTPPTIGSGEVTVAGLSVSLNGVSNEFSNELDFIFSSLRVVGPLRPDHGTANGGGTVTVTGEQFVNVTCAEGSTQDCLTCRFTSFSAWRPGYTPGETPPSHFLVAATFVSDTEVTCRVPSTAEFGQPPENVLVDEQCGEECNVYVSVSVNSVDFVPANEGEDTRDGSIVYRYIKTVEFTSFFPASGPITGDTNVTVQGIGFAPNMDIWCKVGTQIVKTRYLDEKRIVCQVPAVAEAVHGGVFVGFSTNGADYCELLPDGLGTQCLFTATPSLDFPFYYHDPIFASDIFPPSGILEGGTEVLIVGSGFTSYGQIFIAKFLDAEVACDTVDSTTIKCLSPAIPSEQNLAGVERYFPDVAVPVQITANRQQFTPLQVGVGCPPNPDLAFDDNPKASCTQPFVMWTWFQLPSILSVGMADGSDVPAFNSLLNQDLYPELGGQLGALTLPQGPTGGGTKVVIKGTDFTSFARQQVINGQGVVCPGGVKPAPPGESCTTTCTFPFRHADPTTGKQELYYECINLQRLADQTSYDPSVYWCVIHGTAPATFSGEWGQCRYFISTFKDYSQGGKVVTDLECLFGETHVPATIVDNSTITCDSPPNPHGIVVPLTVTLNRRDYALLSARTQFQYIAPAPVAVAALPNPQISEIRVTFDVPTNKAGLLASDGVLRSDDVSKSGCSTLLDDSFIASLGDTPPTCKWLPGSQILSITPSNLNPTFLLDDVVKFKSRPCESDDTCWDNRVMDDLLSAPTARPGCVYTPMTLCNTNLQHSYEAQWCGRCHPSDDDVEVVSYPFNQSSVALRISPPDTIIAPMPVVTAPSHVDSCLSLCSGGSNDGTNCQDDGPCLGGGTCMSSLVTLVGSVETGRLGRDFALVRWFIEPAMSSPDYAVVTELNRVMPQHGALTAQVMWGDAMPQELMPDQHYCFGLEITNWLGAAANTTECHKVTRSESAVAQITIVGQKTRTATLSDELELATEASSSSCAANTSTLSYAWDVRPQPSNWAATAFSKTRNTLTVPALTVDFTIGATYLFRLNATLATPGQPSTMVSAEISVTIAPQAPVARIQGGSYREISAMDTLTLSAEGSYDQDIAMDARAEADLIYCWSCAVATVHGAVPDPAPACLFTNDTYYTPHTGMHANSSLVAVPPGDLLDPGTVYEVNLHVAKAAAGRTCAHVWGGAVSLVSAASVQVAVSVQEALPEATIYPPDSAYLSADLTIRISAFVAGSACPAEGMSVAMCGISGYEWTLDGHSSVDDLDGAVGLTGASYGLITLVIPPGRLIPGQAGNLYTFNLRVTDLTGATTTSTLTLEYNTGPEHGSFTAATSDATGYALSSTFTLSCSGWVDEHTPLSYQFFYTATTYSDADESVVTPVNVIALGGAQLGTSLSTELPQGNLKNDNTMTLYARVYDSLGAMTEVSVNIKVLRDATSVEARGTAVKATYDARIAELVRTGDPTAIYRYIGIVGNVLGDPVLKQSRYSVEVGDIFSSLLATITDLSTTEESRRALAARGRRALSAYTALTSPSEVTSIANSQYAVLSAKTLASITASECETVVQQIRGQIAPLTIALGSSEALETSTLNSLVWVIGICQNAQASSTQQQWDYVREALQGLLLNYLRGKSGTTYQANRNDLAVFATRGTTTVNDVATEATLPPDSTTLKYTNRVLTGLSGLGTHVDVHAVAYNQLTNPFSSSDTQEVSSRVVSVNVFKALASGSSTVPTSEAPLSISGLADAHKVELKMNTFRAPPPKNFNDTTGVFTATVCSFWNASSSLWVQFHTAYQVGTTGSITCKSDHLTDFATVPGTVGCDSLASQTPTTNNICLLCGGGTPKPMQGICDWQGQPCGASVAKDRCGVCGGSNVSFASDARRNESGVCDYRGVACGVVANFQQIPTVCGICANPSQRAETERNAGICDCQGTGVPNGGKVLDRCQVCDGGNSSMDYCGHSPRISVSLVCHTGGVDSTWNQSCTGCDGVPRPDLGLGGVVRDVCGECGGTGANCTGCDGVQSSNAKNDVCGVCIPPNQLSLTGLSCQDCDGVSRVPPKQIDSCGVCGGANFGACDRRNPQLPVPCNYHSLTPQYICKQGCDGESGSGAKYDRCGRCNGDNSTCFDIPECRANAPECPGINKGCACSACARKWKELTGGASNGCQCGVYQDACGKCGGDSTSCLGCDGKPMSGKVFDLCGQCDGDNSRCLGCDGEVNSGKTFDLCGVCDGGNAGRDICGICGGDGSSCTGCDEKIFSGKSVDACDECGGTNRCKWRDGDPPAESRGSTDAVAITLTIDRSRRRAAAAAASVFGGAGEGGEAWMAGMVAAALASVAGVAVLHRALRRWEEEALAQGEEA